MLKLHYLLSERGPIVVLDFTFIELRRCLEMNETCNLTRVLGIVEKVRGIKGYEE